ncbi:high affinity immunoglobulin gamma Fc receptor I-like isoform X2 [Cheilinus undulatus]|uniref:high affinity immunoglobulin gamma Fc receptor I-like isoform X2 n=1 Tax=Cheilinus undulatus TaxID=241271 RepID=UPI001BD3F668|nr:high affinity immunoglobulin gamma Fc receptor I-like isoform X2 [Cheilinus undulatus]
MIGRCGDTQTGRSPSQDPVLSHCGSGWGHQTSTLCDMKTIKVTDSGMYWCESKYRDSSDTVNITVSQRTVIIEGPAHPVTEGEEVTLRCQKKNSSSLPANFYKNGFFIREEPTGHMTFQRVSKSDEGAYKCRIGKTESLPSWLLVNDSEPVMLMVSADSSDSSQMFEYRNLCLRCGNNSRSLGWRVTRATFTDQKLSPCGGKWGSPSSSGCCVSTAKKSDSATYWCESVTSQRSNSARITVHGGDVILQSPVRPVAVGDNVTLHCKTRSDDLAAEFYSGNELIGNGTTGHMTIYHVSTSDEGQYWCNIKGHGKSLPSWLFVRDPNVVSAFSSADSPLTSALCKVVVVCLYVVCTVLAAMSYPCRPKGENPSVSMAMSSLQEDDEGSDHQYDDAIANVTTEYHF